MFSCWACVRILILMRQRVDQNHIYCRHSQFFTHPWSETELVIQIRPVNWYHGSRRWAGVLFKLSRLLWFSPIGSAKPSKLYSRIAWKKNMRIYHYPPVHLKPTKPFSGRWKPQDTFTVSQWVEKRGWGREGHLPPTIQDFWLLLLLLQGKGEKGGQVVGQISYSSANHAIRVRHYRPSIAQLAIAPFDKKGL